MTTDLASDSVNFGTQSKFMSATKYAGLRHKYTCQHSYTYLHIYIHVYGKCSHPIIIHCLSTDFTRWNKPNILARPNMYVFSQFSKPFTVVAGTLLLNKFQPERVSATLRQEALDVCLLPSTQWLAW